MRVLVSGGRNYDNWARVHGTLSQFHERYGISCIIQGEARGADFCAKTWAMNNGVRLASRDLPGTGLTGYPAKWAELGHKAGIVRNQEMLSDADPNLVIIFPGGKGTAHMRTLAIACEYPTLIVPDREWELANGHDEDLVIVFDDDGPPPEKPYWGYKPRADQRFEPLTVRQEAQARQAEAADRYREEAMF